MSIQERKGTRGTTYRFEKMVNGKRHSKTFKSLSDAESYAAKFDKSQLEAVTIKEMFRVYFRETKVKDYKGASNHANFWINHFGSANAMKITHLEVDMAIQELIERGLSENTTKRYRTTLSQCYELNGVDKYNPARNVSYDKSKKNAHWYV